MRKSSMRTLLNYYTYYWYYSHVFGLLFCKCVSAFLLLFRSPPPPFFLESIPFRLLARKAFENEDVLIEFSFPVNTIFYFGKKTKLRSVIKSNRRYLSYFVVVLQFFSLEENERGDITLDLRAHSCFLVRKIHPYSLLFLKFWSHKLYYILFEQFQFVLT